MSNTEQPDRIDSSQEQKQEINDASAAENSALDAPVEELEQRIAPSYPTESISFTYGTMK